MGGCGGLVKGQKRRGDVEKGKGSLFGDETKKRRSCMGLFIDARTETPGEKKSTRRQAPEKREGGKNLGKMRSHASMK